MNKISPDIVAKGLNKKMVHNAIVSERTTIGISLLGKCHCYPIKTKVVI